MFIGIALSSHNKFMMSWRSRGPSRLATFQSFVHSCLDKELTEISTGMMTDVGTNALMCFETVNVRMATAREGHFLVECRRKRIVLEQTAFNGFRRCWRC